MTIRLIAIMTFAAQLVGCATTGSGSAQHAADRQPGQSSVSTLPASNGTTRERLTREVTYRVVDGFASVFTSTIVVVGVIGSVFIGGGGMLREDYESPPGAEFVSPLQ